LTIHFPLSFSNRYSGIGHARIKKFYKEQEVMKMTDITTTDLSKFGYRERVIARELLEAWEVQGLPEDFEETEVTIMFNMYSGNVFLTNSEFQVAMMCDDKLESFYSCPQCGNEGFDGENGYEFRKYNGFCSEACEKA
jgi:hypothetical protein